MDGWVAKPSRTGPLIRQWAGEFPRLVRLIERRTFGGHTAFAVTVTDPDAPGPKAGLLVAQPHAHEPATTAGMMSFLAQLLTGRDLAGRAAPFDHQLFLREAELTFLPDGNPDGRARAPVEAWDGAKYTNEKFLAVAFGTTPAGQRFPRQGRWSLDDQKPATIGIVYEQISPREYVEPNRDADSTFSRLVRAVLAERRVERWLSLHQTEFENSPHNAMILLPFCQAELPKAVRERNEAWGRAVIRAWRAAGAKPAGDPRPLRYGEDQLRYFRACWSDVYARTSVITVEIQNNSPRTPPAAQMRLQEAAIQASIEDMLS